MMGSSLATPERLGSRLTGSPKTPRSKGFPAFPGNCHRTEKASAMKTLCLTASWCPRSWGWAKKNCPEGQFF